MNAIYNAERLSILDAILKRRIDMASGRPWMLEPGGMRFKHGESMAELKVPYHMGGDDEACIEDAILGLMALLMKRHDPANIEGRKESSAPPVIIAPLKEKTFRTDIFISDSLEKQLAAEILSSTPHIDSAILANWLGSEGHGRKFMKWVSDLFEKTLKDEAKHGSGERTSYLALLAAVNTIRKKKEKIKEFRIKGLSYEKIDLVVGMALFITFKRSVKDLFEKLSLSNAPWYNPSAETLLLSAVAPKSFLTIPSNLLSSMLNPYGINNEICEIISPYSNDITEKAQSAAEFIENTSEMIKNNIEAFESIKQHYDIARFRQEALRYMVECDFQGMETQEILYDLYNEDRLIKNFLSDSRMSANLNRALEETKRFSIRDSHRVEVISSFQRFLSSFKKASVLGGFLWSTKKEVFEDILPVIEGYYACRFDDHVERFEALARGYLADRRGEFRQNTIIEEYNRGRLYRFSTDERPILKTLELEEEGQLFIDMKDFTRKTLKVKEIAMAEFMKEHFYKPILSAASRYGLGTGFVKDERGILLANLPGDAAIFSGGVTYLTALAKDVQQIARRYREQLLQRLPPRKDEEILEEVHKRFEARKLELRQKRAELNEAFDRNEPGVESKLVALGEEEHRLENTYRDEIEMAIKGELEAGLYISYGAKAEIMVIEPKGDFSGTVQVSIGEKINEAARGTFRNPMVRAKLEVLLENERQGRKNKKLKYPFDIYIDRIYSIKMPPELENAFEKLIASRKLSNAQAMAQIVGNEFLNDLKRIISGDPFSSLRLTASTTDIYNKGQAMSKSALEAYIRETRGTKRYFQKTLNASELDPSIREAFFFPVEQMEFWFGVETIKGVEKTEAFYRCGEIIFKGFEANTPVVVYEILNTEDEFFKALMKYHVRAWEEESKKTHGEEAF